MQKHKSYSDTKFSADVLNSAIERFKALAALNEHPYRNESYCVEHDDCRWNYDNFPEYLADYRKFSSYSYVDLSAGERRFRLTRYERQTDIEIHSDNRSDIETVFSYFENAAPFSKIPPPPTPKPAKPTIFIGHGRSFAWRALKDHLQDKHDYSVEAYESGARAGHTIRDILEDMIRKSSFAILVLTAEDEQLDGQLRARQNVVHEAGLFQGKLGFPRAIMLIENGVEEFSNVQGIQYIGFSAGRIKETFGEVLATLKREFGS